MQSSLLIAAAAAVVVGLAWPATGRAADAATQPATQSSAPQSSATQPTGTQVQTASYGIGYDIGRSIKESHFGFDTDQIVEGLRDCLGGKDSKITPEAFRDAMTKVQQQMQSAAQADTKNNGDAVSKSGDAFRAENAKKAGVKVTASGLQIETVKEGTGASPTPANTVKVHYTGKLIDGTTFDSSVDRGQPIEFPLNGVIAGWTEGLQLMKVGGKSRLVIPPELAYGARGAPPTIPPNSTLVFDVELLDIKK